MSRYIDEELVVEALQSCLDTDSIYDENNDIDYISHDDAVKFISEVPTADVKPVVHGKWIYTPRKRLVDETDEGPIYKTEEKCSCSVCGADFGYRKVEDNYCKYCGSQMDGE